MCSLVMHPFCSRLSAGVARPRETPPKVGPKISLFEVEILRFPCPIVTFFRPEIEQPCPQVTFLRGILRKIQRRLIIRSRVGIISLGDKNGPTFSIHVMTLVRNNLFEV